MTKRKKIAMWCSGAVAAAALVAIPAFAITNVTKDSVAFDVHNIGVYCEKQWKPAYELAIKKYNEGNHSHKIQLKESGALDAVQLIDTLGTYDQKVADIIYMPLDKIPELVQNKQALMGFTDPNELLEGIDPSVYGNTDAGLNAYAKKGAAIVKDAKGNKNEYYFAISHATEALIMFCKGYDQSEIDNIKTKTFKQLYTEVNQDGWNNKMISFQLNNLWLSLGVVAGFLEQAEAGSGTNGQNVGRVLATFNEESTKFQSNLTRIKDVNNVSGMQPLDQIPGWTQGGKATPLAKANEAMKKAVEFIATFYKDTLSTTNPKLDGLPNDWLLGDTFGSKQEELFKNKDLKGIVIDGPWATNGLFKDGDKWITDESKLNAIPVVNIDSGVPYLQAPGGWMYGINNRNAKNESKIADIKSFINILLTDPEVIRMQYDVAGKIIDGEAAEAALKTNPATKLEGINAKVLDAVFSSKKMDARPDGGNAEFGNAWGAWDGDGWKNPDLVSSFKSPDGNTVSKAIDILQRSFQAMVDKLAK